MAWKSPPAEKWPPTPEDGRDDGGILPGRVHRMAQFVQGLLPEGVSHLGPVDADPGGVVPDFKHNLSVIHQFVS
jgi:hypothetical protein